MMPNATTAVRRMYFQAGYRFMDQPVCCSCDLCLSLDVSASAPAAGRGRWFQRSGGGIERALGDHLSDRTLLHLDQHAVGEFDLDEVVAHFGHLAQQHAGGDD